VATVCAGFSTPSIHATPRHWLDYSALFLFNRPHGGFAKRSGNYVQKFLQAEEIGPSSRQP